MQSRFDAIELSGAQINQIQKKSHTTPIYSKKKKKNRNPEINGEGTMLKKHRTHLKEPS